MASLFCLTISPYTPLEVYCEIYPSLEGNIERSISQYSIFYLMIYCEVYDLLLSLLTGYSRIKE